MAGVSDEPFRQLCSDLGAGITVSEMVTSEERLWSSRKSRQRLSALHSTPQGSKEEQTGKTARTKAKGLDLRSVQLAGNDPEVIAAAARSNPAMGADVIDINMGCPEKKGCKKAAGSALLQDEKLVADILTAVVKAVDIPVTLKIRTGWSPEHRNGLTIAHIAEQAGISALAVHGRTRACAFKGDAEYDTIAEIAGALTIPVFANGDITSPEKAKAVLDYTGANAVMIGRAAQGNPWIFREINHYLAHGTLLAKPSNIEVRATLRAHLQQLHHFYGDLMGVRIARKHVGWYLKQQSTQLAAEQSNEQHERINQTQNQYEQCRQYFNRIETTQEQLQAVEHFFTTSSSTQIFLTTKDLKGEIAA
jgi:tRNA-dihydrouridine synthase B